MNRNTGYSGKIVTVLLLGVVCLFNLFPSCNVSTAGLSDVKLCSSKSGSGCDGDKSSFAGDTPVIYCSANVNNAPSDTKVNFEWKHGSESLGKADVVTSGGIVISNFTTNGAVEPGKYSVTVKIDSDNSAPVTKEFTIEEAAE